MVASINSGAAARSLQVCLDARFENDRSGSRQVVLALANAVSSLNDGDEEYWFLASPDAMEQLQPFIRGRCRVLLSGKARGEQQKSAWWRRAAGRAPGARGAWHLLRRIGESSCAIPVSDGTVERNAVDLMHFTIQSAFRTAIPSTYQPHDLQHNLHSPQFFPRREWRGAKSTTGCKPRWWRS